MKGKPIVGITLGDAAGIGPEITIKALSERSLYDYCIPLIIGDPKVAKEAIELTKTSFRIREVSSPSECRGEPGTIDILPIAAIEDSTPIVYGKVNAILGESSVKQSMEAARLALAGEIDAICSAPVNKESMRLAGYKYEGQTQLFGEFCRAKKWGMLLLFGNIRCYMLTNHLALSEAINKVTKENILSALDLISGSIQLFVPDRQPIVAVSALNPHAGENGLFGREEIDEINPALEEANIQFPNIKSVGPIPSDTIFVRANNGEFDAVVTLFHDQANMAMKLLGFGEIVTYILGLPIIRTSVGHGTAYDIAGYNRANHKNMYVAIQTAAYIAKMRKINNGK
jgi:4-hydroxythreonine-4-phosphate dehydrogenase